MRQDKTHGREEIHTLSNSSPISLQGIFPPVPTPFREDSTFDPVGFSQNFDHWNQEPLNGYVVLGSNGEFPYVSEAERVEIVRVARREISSDRLLIAGSGMDSTVETIRMTQTLADVGADVAIVITPNYYKGKMTGPALEAHYVQVAAASPIPILIYNMPAYASVDMPADAIIRAAQHPNIIGMKESGPKMGKLGQIMRATTDFQVLTGSASGFLAALAMGAVGGVMALANFAAHQLAAIRDNLLAGDLEGAQEIQLRMIPPNLAVTGTYGIAGLKAALDMLGYCGGPVRSPLQPLGEAEKVELRRILMDSGLLAK